MTYPGSAGGQPRLTLPFTRLNPQDPKFAEKFEAITRTLTTWANSLLIGGSSSLVAYGKYGSTLADNSNIDPVTWTPIDESFDYFSSGGQSLANFPTNTITLAQFSIRNTAGVIPGSPPQGEILILFDSVSDNTDTTAAAFVYEDAAAGTPLAYWVNPVGFGLFDSTSLQGTPPYHFSGTLASAGGNLPASLVLLSWSKP